MKHITSKMVLLAMMVMLPALMLSAQAKLPRPLPEVKAMEIWAGNWILTGTAKDGPNDKEYPLIWRMHGRWMLRGFIVQIDHESVGNATAIKYLEVMNFNPSKKSYISTGYGDDGSSWISILTYKGDICLENGNITLPDGKIISFRSTWTFSSDHLSVIGSQECEQDGSKWIGYKIKGSKTQ